MKFLFNLLVLIALIIGALIYASPYFFFPKPDAVSPQVAQVQNYGDVDGYIRQVEAPFLEDIRPGLQKTVTWYDSNSNAKSDIAIVYIHGWSASLKDTAPLINLLANRLHSNVYYARLTAHGMKRPDAFAKLRMQNLIDDVREAVAIGKKIGKHVLLVGISTGATLAVEQAFETRESSGPDAVVLLSPNFMPLKKEARFISGPFGQLMARALVGPTYSFPAQSPQHAEYWTTSYPSEGLVPMMDLVNYTNSLDLSQIHTPVLVLYTHFDKVVNISAIRRKFQQWGEAQPGVVKEMIDLEGATQHELVGDLFGPNATVNSSDAITDFAKRVMPRN